MKTLDVSARVHPDPAENPYPVLRIDQNGLLTYANPAGSALLRTWAVEIGRPLSEPWRHVALAALREGKAREVVAEVDESTFLLKFLPFSDAGYVNVYTLDITDRKLAEELVRTREATLRTLLESASQGILLIRGDGRIILANAQIERLFGYPRNALIGLDVETLIPDVGPYLRRNVISVGAREEGRGREPVELVGRRAAGETFPIEVNCSFVETPEGSLQGLVFVTDISAWKQSQAELEAYSERLEEVVEERTQELLAAQRTILVQERLQREVELGAEIQESLLPREVPDYHGFELAARAEAARFVSGDLYDFVPVDDQHCLVVVADIAGKGVPAAMLTSTARALLRAEARHSRNPAEILARVNQSLYDDLTHAEMFITFLVARLDAAMGHLAYANAGHLGIVWWREADRSCAIQGATGLPVGIFGELSITEETLPIRPGDLLLFYSDGVTEALNADGELFGEDRLIRLVVDNARLSASELVDLIVEQVRRFQGMVPLSDDITMVILKALPRTYRFACPATLDHLHQVTDTVRQAGASYDSDFAYELELAVSELATNVIQHAYQNAEGELRVVISLAPDAVEIELYDDGISFDPAAVPAPDPDQLNEGGYGLIIAHQVVDELTYLPASPKGNCWRMVKYVTEA
jgi:PAS domain S-box-containing protein